MFRNSVSIIEAEADPNRLNSNWGYSRYNAYYNYYGEDAPETKQAEADSK